MGIFQPATGFHFAVVFEIFPQTDKDLRFQEVSGIAQELGTEELAEGGENRFSHALPTKTSYQNLVLKRGLFIGSGIIAWARKAIENMDIQPTNATVTLLNEMHLPIAAWYVVNAYPVKWSFSNFNAQENSIVVETIEFKYQYFNSLLV